METKHCNCCGKDKPLSQFYKKSNNRYCNNCSSCEREIKYYKYHNDDIPDKPNKYITAEQRQLTFEVMTAIGWLYNTENGIWYNEEFGKDKNGVWDSQKMKKVLVKSTNVI